MLDKAKMALSAGTYIKIGENEKQEFYMPHSGSDSER